MSARRRWPIARRITQRPTIDYTHKKQTGGSGQFAQRQDRRSSRTRPAQASSSRTRSSAARCRRNTSRASRRASESVLDSGVLAGFPVVDVKVTLDRRRLSRRRLVGAGLRDRGPRRASAKRCAKARPDAARADHEGRGGDAGGLHRRASSATSTRGAARSRARTRAATPRSSPPWCRSPTCSATSTTCAR